MYKTIATTGLLALSLPAFAGAAELDEIKGWRAAHTATINAAPEHVLATAGDLTTWKDWTNWSVERDPEAVWEFKGEPNTVGHEMIWVGPELGTGRLVFTEVTDSGFSFDLFFGKSKKVSKGYFDAAAGDANTTTVTWETAGPMGGLGRLLFAKKVNEMMAVDYSVGITNLTPIAENAQAVADATAKYDGLETAAKAAEADAATKTEAAATATTAAETATAAVATAKRRDKAAAQEAADTATKAAEEATAAADAATKTAAAARTAADAAKTELAALTAAAPAETETASASEKATEAVEKKAEAATEKVEKAAVEKAEAATDKAEAATDKAEAATDKAETPAE